MFWASRSSTTQLTEESVMGIGLGLVLVAIGAILYFAVDASVSGVDLPTVGVVLMIVGVVGVLLDLLLFMPRRRRSTTVTDTPTGRHVTRETDV
jgi:hypothetical protein